jgi:hypothetical protein
MDSLEIEDAQWRQLPDERQPEADTGDMAVVRARARLAQATALRDMESTWRRGGRRVISAPAPRLCEIGRGRSPSLIWLASCGGTRAERARAAEALAVDDFLNRPPRPRPPLRSI